MKDLEHAKDEIIIESPFITIERVSYFLQIFKKLIKRGIKVCVYTRIIEEQSEEMQYQAEKGIDILEEIGVFVAPANGFMHRKLAVIDKNIVWEGSLNILSQRNSKEVMRRIADSKQAVNMLLFLKFR